MSKSKDENVIQLENELKKYQIIAEENEYRYNKMKDAFLQLIEDTKIYRDRLGYDSRDWEYDKLEQAGILDDYE